MGNMWGKQDQTTPFSWDSAGDVKCGLLKSGQLSDCNPCQDSLRNFWKVISLPSFVKVQPLTLKETKRSDFWTVLLNKQHFWKAAFRIYLVQNMICFLIIPEGRFSIEKPSVSSESVLCSLGVSRLVCGAAGHAAVLNWLYYLAGDY